MNLTKEEKEEEERLTIRKKVTLEDLAMQPLEFSFDISTSENEKSENEKCPSRDRSAAIESKN